MLKNHQCTLFSWSENWNNKIPWRTEKPTERGRRPIRVPNFTFLSLHSPPPLTLTHFLSLLFYTHSPPFPVHTSYLSLPPCPYFVEFVEDLEVFSSHSLPPCLYFVEFVEEIEVFSSLSLPPCPFFVEFVEVIEVFSYLTLPPLPLFVEFVEEIEVFSYLSLPLVQTS